MYLRTLPRRRYSGLSSRQRQAEEYHLIDGRAFKLGLMAGRAQQQNGTSAASVGSSSARAAGADPAGPPQGGAGSDDEQGHAEAEGPGDIGPAGTLPPGVTAVAALAEFLTLMRR